MYIPKELVSALQGTYERKFGKRISAKEAEQNLSDLAELIKLISRERRDNYEKSN